MQSSQRSALQSLIRLRGVWQGLALAALLDLVILFPMLVLVAGTAGNGAAPRALQLVGALLVFGLIAGVAGWAVRDHNPWLALGLLLGYSLLAVLSGGIYTFSFRASAGARYGPLAGAVAYGLVLFFMRALVVLTRLLSTLRHE